MNKEDYIKFAAGVGKDISYIKKAVEKIEESIVKAAEDAKNNYAAKWVERLVKRAVYYILGIVGLSVMALIFPPTRSLLISFAQ